MAQQFAAPGKNRQFNAVFKHFAEGLRGDLDGREDGGRFERPDLAVGRFAAVFVFDDEALATLANRRAFGDDVEDAHGQRISGSVAGARNAPRAISAICTARPK